jgi:PKD repeat protein
MKQRLLIVTVILLFFVIGASPVMALNTMPGNSNVNLSVVNDAGARFNDNGDDTYNFFAEDQSSTQGLNALHLSRTNESVNYGQVTFSRNQSGVFYMSDTGGRGWDDNGVLMLAVNGTVPDNFRVHITSSGYRWTPVPTGNYPPYSDITHVPGAVDEYFTKDDFLYGPQIWKPCPAANYTLYEGQDMADTANTFSIMFIDLNAGILGSNALYQSDFTGKSVKDNGSIRIAYSFENLSTLAAFNAYAYTVSSNQGQGIRWTNRVTDFGSSGYYVIGKPPVTPPLANFTATPRSGKGPLSVTFTDTSTNTPTSRQWAYRNATVGWTRFSSAKNPKFTFPAGTYDINLTARNAGGSNRTIKTGYIRVTVPAPLANFTATPRSGKGPLSVSFTDTSTNTPTSRQWAYRNATVGWTRFSSAKNPKFTFPAGTYDINLTATNAGGSNRTIKTGYIRVTVPAPLANFTAAPRSGKGPLSVTFTDTSTNTPTSRQWAYRNATTGWTRFAIAKNPKFTFPAGTYDINLTATNAGGSNRTIKTGFILVTS